jgi:hypothetical protein
MPLPPIVITQERHTPSLVLGTRTAGVVHKRSSLALYLRLISHLQNIARIENNGFSNGIVATTQAGYQTL